jgi:hypothetical protein
VLLKTLHGGLPVVVAAAVLCRQVVVLGHEVV